MSRIFILLLACISLTACATQETRSDAYGNFEATATTISAESNGKLLFLKITEGQKLKAGELIAIVDTTQAHLQRKQIEASLGTLPQKLKSSLADIEVLKNQQANLIRERDRVKRLVEKKAAPSKQLDDLNGEIEVVEKRIQAIQAQTQIANRSILSEKAPMLAKMDIVNDQIRRSYIYNPIEGIVLTKLAEAHELAAMGKPLYRIADLDTMTLRFYASASQLDALDLGQDIQVLVDDGKEEMKPLAGRVSWIAEQAEFTPKTIQTKEDRVNLVYAVKAKVANPKGELKIGMPAEVNFQSE